jgi:serine/threonine protein kinase
VPDSARRSATSRSFPKRVGRYDLLLPIASGGMASVYLGRMTGLGGFEREVAVKLTHEHLRAEPAFTTALIDEARFAGRIRHPNVVSVLDVSEYRHGVFIVMDYVEGDSLAGLVAALPGQRVPLDITLRLLDDILSGLHAAHELTDPSGVPLDLVHRDVTPHNVLIGADGVARLTDFGIAKAAGRLTLTQTGLVKGKLTYMPPEQARAHPLDRTCDVWAVGVIAWELLSGRRLYEGLEEPALLLKVVREPPPPLVHVAPDVPRELAEVVAGALAFDRERRYPTAEAFAEALSQAARSLGIAPADTRRLRDFVGPIFEPHLTRRRRRLAKIYSRDSDRASIPGSEPPPASERGGTGSRVRRIISDSDIEPPRLDVPTPSSHDLRETEALVPSRTSVADLPATESLVPPLPAVRSPAAWALILVVIAALIAAVAVGLMALGARSTAEAAPTATTASPPPPLASPAGTTTPTAATADPNDIPILSPSALPLASTTPSATSAPKRGGRPVVRPAPKPTAKEPEPLGNPWTK